MAAPRTATPGAKDLGEAFGEAMSTPPRATEPAPPPPVDPDAPFGRDENDQPKAPYGYTKDGKVRRSAAGRKPGSEDKPRTAPAAPPGQDGRPDPAAPPVQRDYSAALSEFGDAVWFAGSALGKAGSAVPLVGRYIPEAKIGAQAAVLHEYKPTLVRAVNVAAQHNARAARFAASIETGEITWVVMCAFLVMPFVTASAAIWKGDEALSAAGMKSTAELAQHNEAELERFLEGISEQLQLLVVADAAEQAAAAMAAAQANGQIPEGVTPL